MKRIAIISLALVGACSGAPFEFRGYTNTATCREVIAAEKRYGTVARVRSEEVPRLGKAEITELTVDLFGRPAGAAVACFTSGVVDVHYTLPSSPAGEQSFDWLSGELRKQFGNWSEQPSTTGRIRTFVCGVPATVRLVEKPDAQAELFVAPRPGVC